MIGQIIQSYLVSLGVQIDKPGFQQADATIRNTGDNIERVTGGMARNFVKASTIIASAMASVTASAVGLMKATANEDLAMQKYARSMMMSEDATWKMKKATDALGESINDIALTPELLNRYNKLVADGNQMMIGGDFKETMRNFRDLMFEFSRLKQEASYALNWVGYYLMKYLQRPLADIREKFKTFNDLVVKNMSVWTEKIARGIYYVLEVGRHFIKFLGDVGRHLKDMWDSFPDGVKKAIVAITALQAVLSAGPLGRAIMLISTLLLLIDDYYGYMEGKDAALGKYWDKLNNFLDTAKQKYEELKATVEPYWDKFIGYVEQAKTWFDELKKSFDEWSSSTGAEMLQDFIDECEDWWRILNDLYDTIENGLKVTWRTFMETLEENDTIDDVRQLLERLWRIFVVLYDAVKDVIEGIIQLADEIAKTEEWQEFIAVVGELFDGVVELFDAIMELVEVALTALFGEFHKTDTVLAFRDVIRAVLKIFTGIIRAVNWVIGLLRDLFKLVAGNTTFKKFWEEVGKEIGNAIEKIGTFGSKIRDLWDWITGKSSDKGQRHGTRQLNAKEKKLEPLVQAAARKYKVDPNAIWAVGMSESNLEHYDSNGNVKTSSAGALGIMQLMPDTAKSLGVDPYDLQQNIEGGAKYLSQLIDTFGFETDEQKRKVFAAYNAGPGAVKEYGGIPPYKETQNYVTKTMDNFHGFETNKAGNLSGDTVAENAMEYEVGDKTIFNSRVADNIQCDTFTAKIYNDSGIASIGGHSTDINDPNNINVINDLAFKAAGAWHEGDGYQPKNGDLVGWNWSETSGHYGIYNADKDIVITRDSRGGIQHRSMREAIAQWGTPTGYGSISEAMRNDQGIPQPQTPQWEGIPARPDIQTPRDMMELPSADTGYHPDENETSSQQAGNDWYNNNVRGKSEKLDAVMDEGYRAIQGIKKKCKEIIGGFFGGGSGFVDAQTAAALGGQQLPQGDLSSIFDGLDFSQLNELRAALMQNKGLFDSEGFKDMMELIDEIQTAGKNSGLFDAMRGGMPDYGRGGVNVGGLNIQIDVGGVTVNGQNMTNADVGMVVAQRTVEKAAEFFEANIGLTLNRMIPTPQMKELFNS
jgi:hypothetical protein